MDEADCAMPGDSAPPPPQDAMESAMSSDHATLGGLGDFATEVICLSFHRAVGGNASIDMQMKLSLNVVPENRSTAENARKTPKVSTLGRGVAPLAQRRRVDRAKEIPLASPPTLDVGGFLIDFGREALIDRHGVMVELRPQAFQVLRYLALHPGRVVTKEELFAAVWPGAVVTDDSVIQAIGDVRHALGEAGRRVIKTIPRRGYILLNAEVVQGGAANGTAAATAPISAPKRAHLFMALLVSGALLAGLVGVGSLQGGRHIDALTGPDARAWPSIAVLAFKSQRSDPEDDALGRDVASELASELARDSELRVVSSQSSFQFIGSHASLLEIAHRLRSRYIVDGTVRRDGEHLRIAIDLIDSQGGQTVWSSAYHADRTTLGAVQQELVSRIAGKLQVSVMKTENRRAIAQPPSTLDVYVLMAHGKSKMFHYSREGIREARRFFEKALAIDPDYAPAWVYLGITNNIDVGLGLTGEWEKSRMPEILGQIRHAIELQPNLASAYAALAQAQTLAGDHDAALAGAQRCCLLSPNSLECFFSLGKTQLIAGEVGAAVQNFERALDLNPIAPAAYSANYATALWGSHRLGEAILAADDCLAKAPEYWGCRKVRISALVELGRMDEARAEAAVLLSQRPQMSVAAFAAGGFADSDATAALRARGSAAARVVGIPDGGHPPDAAIQGNKVGAHP